MTILLPLLLALLAAPLAALTGWRRPGWAAPVAIALAGLTFTAILWAWLAGGGSFSLAWVPTWDIHLAFRLDGLAALYALLASGIGCLVLIYSSAYIPRHLAHERRPATEQVRFYAFMLLFMGAMVGLVMAQDLVLMFLFWDMTAVASYFLIGYDRHQAESRQSALMALLVTGITSILFLIGALILYAGYQTFSLPALIEQVRPGLVLNGVLALMVAAALAKSAQVPFHFWLPRAMAAPTPVSAYLHSAAMVAAGVFLIGRLYPLLRLSQPLLDGLLLIGLGSMAVAGVLALTADVLKQVLAYSTIAQYGYVVFMFGLGGEAGVIAATFYVVAHGLIKSALFLTAGAVTEATGHKKLSGLGGLARRIPLLAVASGLLAAGLAGLPLTLGFFKDDLFFAAAFRRGWPFPALAVAGAALTLAYMWRFWSGIFLGQAQGQVHPLPARLVGPVVALALLVLAAGLYVQPLAHLAEAAGAASFGAATPAEMAYHLDLRPVNVMALATYGLGLLLILSRPLWTGAAGGIGRLGQLAGPERWYRVGLLGMIHLSTWIYRSETRNLSARIATILVPAAGLTLLGLAATPAVNVFRVGQLTIASLPLILSLLLTAAAGFATTIPVNHLTQVLALAAVGNCMVAVFTLYGGPNVAMVAVLMGTMSVLFFLAILTLFPREVLHSQAARATLRPIKWRQLSIGILSGVFAFIVAWSILSQTPAQENVALEYLQLAQSAHANNVVTAILADFRGLDTVGEITVIGVALLGIFTLMRGRETE